MKATEIRGGIGAVLAAAMLLTIWPIESSAATDRWAITRLKTNAPNRSTASTFRDLLQSELSAQLGGAFETPNVVCGDSACAAEVGQQLGAGSVVFGTLSRLGRKVIVTVSVVKTATGAVASSHRMSTDRVEELDKVATRIAEAIAEGKTTKETARLGTITRSESRAPRRRDGDHAFSFRLGALANLGDSYGGVPAGMYIDLGYWFEAEWFAIETRNGFHFDTDRKDPATFFEIPLDFGAYFVPALGDFAPYIGGGVGVHWIYDNRKRKITTGAILQTTHEAEVDDHSSGFGLYARAGVMLFRTYKVRMTLSVDYHVTFVTVNDVSTPQNVQIGIGMIL